VIECQECAAAEYREAHPVRAMIRAAAAGIYAEFKRPSLADIVRDQAVWMGDMLRLVGGGHTSHYNRHRDEFVRTGEQLELDRMLRVIR
jgi:hypothetical protein